MNKTGKLSDVYHGESAKSYDKRRKGKKWEGEERAFAQLFSLTAPQQIIDCPIGTGRWIDLYKERVPERGVTGVDVSADMLKEAEKAFDKMAVPVDLVNCDIFSEAFEAFDGIDGLLVSTRFLNWVHRSDLPKVIEVYNKTNPRWIILSLRYKDGRSLLENGRRLLDAYILRKRSLVIHDKAEVVRRFEDKGFRIVHEVMVECSSATTFSYFLFEKDSNG